MFDRARHAPNDQALVEVVKSSVCKLSSIFGYDCVGHSKMEDYVSTHKILYLLRGDGRKRFGLNPLGEVIHSH